MFRPVTSPIRLLAAILLTAIALVGTDTSAVSPPLIIGPVWVEVKKLEASDGAQLDEFGWSLAILGETVVVGAPFKDIQTGGGGAAYIFERNHGGPNNWAEIRKILASDSAGGDAFGNAVSISGDTLVVGAIYEDTGGNATGAAYLFERHQGGPNNWGQVRKIKAADPSAGDGFGSSVGISSDTVIVGAYGDSTSGFHTGAAYIFERNHGGPNNWGQVRKLVAPEPQENAEFGYSVAIDGDTAIATAPNDFPGGGAYLFQRNRGGSNNWGQIQRIPPSDPGPFDGFGTSAAISADTIVVGAMNAEVNGARSGAAYIFERSQTAPYHWEEVRELVASDAQWSDQFGISVGISGNTAIVGANTKVTTGISSGAAYVFERNEGGPNDWGQVQILLGTDTDDYDYFGVSVGIGPDTAVVGADGKDAGRGAAYVFGPDPIFSDGFESGDTSKWSATVP